MASVAQAFLSSTFRSCAVGVRHAAPVQPESQTHCAAARAIAGVAMQRPCRQVVSEQAKRGETIAC